MIEHHFGGGTYAKQYTLPAGEWIVQHKHVYDHLSILASGTVLLNVDGATREITGPACLVIEKNKHHAVKAVGDAVWFCIHATDDEYGLIEPKDHAEAQRAADALGLGSLS